MLPVYAIISGSMENEKINKTEQALEPNQKIPADLIFGPLVYKLGPTETLKLCNQNKFECPDHSLVYKFIKIAQHLGEYNELLSEFHALRCKSVQENETNPIGLKTRKECLSTIVELREWVGLDELRLTKEQKADIQGLNFDGALKCRWSRELAAIPIQDIKQWNEKLQTCLENIQTQRIELGLDPLNETEMSQLNEPRYIQPFILNLFIQVLGENHWNPKLFEIGSMKTWLDQGGDVTIIDQM